jgi:hypothetical protein
MDVAALFRRQRRSTFYPKTDAPFLAAALRALRSGDVATVTQEDLATICLQTLGEAPVAIAPWNEQGTFHRLFRVFLTKERPVVVRINALSSIMVDYSLLADAWALDQLAARGLPSLRVFGADITRRHVPFDFEVLEEARGFSLKALDDDESRLRPLLRELGQWVARFHGIAIAGFGWLDVTPLLSESTDLIRPRPAPPPSLLVGEGQGGEARDQLNQRRSPTPTLSPQRGEGRTGSGHGRKVVGIFKNWRDYLLLHLDDHLATCRAIGALKDEEVQRIETLFGDLTSLLDDVAPVLLHGDLGSHNVFTTGHTLTALIDWEDCLAGDPVFDIAFWATFHPDSRHAVFLEGYQAERSLPDDFALRFWLYYLRIALSKTVHRHRFGHTDRPGRPPAARRIQKALDHLESSGVSR